MNRSAAASAGGLVGERAVGPRYQERPSVPGIGKLSNDCSKPGYGQPGFDEFPAPLSNRIRIAFWASNADLAAP